MSESRLIELQNELRVLSSFAQADDASPTLNDSDTAALKPAEQSSKAWLAPVSKSTTNATKLYRERLQKQRDRTRVYTEGMSRVIVLKTAESMAVGVPRKGLKGIHDLEYLTRRWTDDCIAKRLLEESSMQSQSVLMALECGSCNDSIEESIA